MCLLLVRLSSIFFFFFFNDTATTEIYTLSYTTLFRSLHGLVLKVDALQPHSLFMMSLVSMVKRRSEEHTSELQSLAYLVCRLLLEKKKRNQLHTRVSIP